MAQYNGMYPMVAIRIDEEHQKSMASKFCLDYLKMKMVLPYNGHHGLMR